jgi:hypothetical protein
MNPVGHDTDHPVLVEINAHVWVERTGRLLGRKASLRDLPDRELDALADLGVDFAWLMGVWMRSEISREIARGHADLRRAYDAALPGWGPADVAGSPYAVRDYRVSEEIGGDDALAGARARLARRGIGLVLDFVPNHTARDHPWVADRPDHYVTAELEAARAEPDRFFIAETRHGSRAIAFGKDPYFPGWTDTAQLNFANADLQSDLIRVLVDVASRCDGVRCDMAMLVLEDVFARTWPEVAIAAPGDARGSFWARAIETVRADDPRFLFLAEAYWGLEKRMIDLGFDYAYDKALYDALRAGDVARISEIVRGDEGRLRHGAHFIENHDEEPAARAFSGGRQRAAAALAATLPGLRFLHEGELEGRRVRLPVQLGRAADSNPERATREFYGRLYGELRHPAFRRGGFRPLEVAAATPEDPSHRNVLAWLWEAGELERRLVVINLGGTPARARLPFSPGGAAESATLIDHLSGWRDAIEIDRTRREGIVVALDAFTPRILSLVPGPTPSPGSG